VSSIGLHPARRYERAFDAWSLMHVGVGYIAGLTGLPIGWAFSLFVGYELVEPKLKSMVGIEQAESLQNQVGDVAAGMLGWAIGKTR
jgi:hypothetical protein